MKVFELFTILKQSSWRRLFFWEKKICKFGILFQVYQSQMIIMRQPPHLLKLLWNEDAEETFSGYLYSAVVDTAGVVAV